MAGRVLAGAAALYLLLAAEFVAITQVLVYIGAIDRAVPLRHHAHPRPHRPRAGPRQQGLAPRASSSRCCSCGTVGYVLIDAFGDDKLPTDPAIQSVQSVSDSIFGPYLIPFWALSFVLLAAVVGAIVLARKTRRHAPLPSLRRHAPLARLLLLASLGDASASLRRGQPDVPSGARC